MIALGDMNVHVDASPKLLKALAVIASNLHQTMERDLTPGITHESCILCSLVMRDFLFRIGFRDAEVRPALVIVTAHDATTGAEIHTLGIGRDKPGMVTRDGAKRWEGHLVTLIPSAGVLIDATLYSARRPAWPTLPGMVALPTMPGEAGDEIWGLKPIAGMEAVSPTSAGNSARVAIVYLDQPSNKIWKKAPDAGRSRRETYVRSLVETFGVWHDTAGEVVKRGEHA